MALDATAVFLSAFLLFSVQPLLGKQLLPWFGGAPAVWTACMLFFQVVLLLGYLWAHLSSRMPPRRQALLQLGLLMLAVGGLVWQALSSPSPLLPGPDMKPEPGQEPVGQLLWMLLLSAGTPYLLLSTLSPTLQAWFHLRWPGEEPYWLYALSNAGSLLGLLAYPFAVEPFLPLRVQAWAWAGLFGALAVLLVFLSLRAMGAVRPPAEPETPGDEASARPLSWGRMALWLTWPAAGSALLVAATNQLCQDVAVVPFLWVAPLALYLLSFILAFGRGRGLPRPALLCAYAAFSSFAVFVLFRGPEALPLTQLLALGGCLLTGCTLCHSELARIRPHPKRLSLFYLCLSAGGALGGIFCALLAPVLFDSHLELHVSMAGVAVLALLSAGPVRARNFRALTGYALRSLQAVWVFLLILALALHAQGSERETLARARNFFGVLRVERRFPGGPDEQLLMMHGSVIHGGQYTRERLTPATAFGEGTALADAIRLHPRRLAGQPMRIGVVGMGVGTIAAHARAGDHLRLYEINPQVIAWARGEGGFFSYLADTAAAFEIEAGDARLALEREMARGQPGGFHVLVVDAFNSASPPVHLLTVEAFRLYLSHLAPDGILAVHLSNANLDLGRLVARQAEELGWPRYRRDNPPRGRTWGASWMLITQNEKFLARPEIAPDAVRPGALPGDALRPWTDDFSNLLDILY
jgi:hypothetical protein